MFYVAVTRAKKRLFIFSEEEFETPFLNDTNIRPINWENSPPLKFGNKLLVKILNKEKSKSESTTMIKEKLKACGYDWVPAGVSSWQKIIDDRNSFLISNLQKESWCEGVEGIEVNINDEDESVLAKYFVDDGKWEPEFDNILITSCD